MTETLAHGYSTDSTYRELSNEYQHDRVSMVFKNLCIIVLWTKVASAFEGLSIVKSFPCAAIDIVDGDIVAGGRTGMVEEDRVVDKTNPSSSQESAVRRDFPETWLWDNIIAGYKNSPKGGTTCA